MLLLYSAEYQWQSKIRNMMGQFVPCTAGPASTYTSQATSQLDLATKIDVVYIQSKVYIKRFEI